MPNQEGELTADLAAEQNCLRAWVAWEGKRSEKRRSLLNFRKKDHVRDQSETGIECFNRQLLSC